MSSGNYKALKIDLSEKDVLKALKGKAIRVSPSMINKGTTFVSLHPENAKKVEKAFMQKKGCLLHLTHGELLDTAERMNGGGIWGNIWHAIKKGWNALKDSGILSAAADAAVAPLAAYTGQPALVSGARQLLKKTTGVGVKMSKQDKYAQMRASGIYLS
jgi:hypothetical protein